MAEAIVSIILEHLALIRQEKVQWRLTGKAENEVGKLESNFLAIQAVLVDAEKRQVKDNAVGDWLHKLKDTSYDIDDVLDEWNTTIQKIDTSCTSLGKVCSLNPCYVSCCRQSALHNDFAARIKNLGRNLDIIAQEKDRFKFSSITKGREEQERQIVINVSGLTKLHGIDEHKKTIVNCLLSKSSQEEGIPIISIIGMRGIGKTTLARLAFYDDKVTTHFDQKIWLCVNDSVDEIMIATKILESLTNVSALNFIDLENVLQNIYQHIEGKKFLLVLDDVWSENLENFKNWNRLKHFLMYGTQDCKILMTTHNENVANIIGTTKMIPLGTLSEKESWSLFSQIAFFGRTNEECENLKEIGSKIIRKCKGLPLAVKILGGLLYFKTEFEDWQNVLDSDLWALEEVERGLFPPLLLSYYDLPSVLRKCFSYCAVFPKDYKIKKNQLIKLWMAQDYLRKNQNMEMEMELVGKEYAEILAARSFFQDIEIDEFDNTSIKSFKMHGIVHEFARFLTKNECFTLSIDGFIESKSESSYKRARQSMIMIHRGFSFPSSVYSQKSSRSLVVECKESACGIVLSKLFDKLRCLRALDLSDCSIAKLPREIKELMHLRYLNLSQNRNLKELPETLCELYNLEILDVSACYRLEKLPLGIGKLINLRHLINHETSLSYMPKGIQGLTRLRTLNKFVVSDDKDDKKACRLECLKNFKHLGGYLIITGLGNVSDVNEVNKATLGDKGDLFGLGLRFNGLMHVDDEVIFQELQPPPGLKELMIQYYIGKTLSLQKLSSLKKLRVLKLSFCLEFEYLPPLGKLSSLESLHISNMKGVKSVGDEFLALDESISTVFRSLKTLEFDNMDEWEKWEVLKGYVIMPRLHSLTVGNCHKLKALPDAILERPTLKKLEINMCTILTESYTKGRDFRSKISHIPSIKIDDKDVRT